MKPRDARTDKQMDGLKTDAYDTPGFWISLNYGEGIILSKQHAGEPEEWTVEIPMRDFNRLIDWYNCDQKPRAAPKRAKGAKQR
ncbi:MAG: hypothetical protein V1899_06715 [Planctomycetota bacterium]